MVSLSAILFLLLVVWLAIAAMPEGFEMTHEKIGTGKPALVFIYDPNLEVSISQTEQMNKARDQLGEQVLFLIAKIGTPEGDQLIAKHQANPSELLFFAPSGELAKRQFALISSGELIQWLKVD